MKRRRSPVALTRLRAEIDVGLCDPACAVGRLLEIAERQAIEIDRLRRKNLKALERASRAIERADANAARASEWWGARFAAMRKETKS